MKDATAFLEQFPATREMEPLAPHSTFGVGGSARYFFVARSEDELVRAVTLSRTLALPTVLIAGGSNLVFGDGLLDLLVIKIGYGSMRVEGDCVIVDAGADLGALVEFSFSQSFAGLESLSGIPGTVGGAIVGNAGAYGRSIGELVESVQVFDGESIVSFSREECGFVYRDSVFKNDRALVVLSATLRLTPGNEVALRATSQEIIKKRERTYARGVPCPGSFFKNVLVKNVSKTTLALVDTSKIIDGKIPAGYLLEQVGSKGMREGGIEVSQNHGNLLVNVGGATRENVRTIVEILKARVKDRFGIALEEEIRYIE